MLLPSPPTPADAGARIRNAGLLELLSADHQVDVLIPTPPSRPRSPVRRFTDMARSDLPDMAQRLWSPEFGATVRRQVQQCAYDAVQAEGIEMARFLDVAPPSSRIYDAHNAEFLLQRRLAHTASPMGRLYSRLQWRRLERFEADLVRHCRMTLAVSEHDANQLIALAGLLANVRVTPTRSTSRRTPSNCPKTTRKRTCCSWESSTFGQMLSAWPGSFMRSCRGWVKRACSRSAMRRRDGLSRLASTIPASR
jgi:hypothetical protein